MGGILAGSNMILVVIELVVEALVFVLLMIETDGDAISSLFFTLIGIAALIYAVLSLGTAIRYNLGCSVFWPVAGAACVYLSAIAQFLLIEELCDAFTKGYGAAFVSTVFIIAHSLAIGRWNKIKDRRVRERE